MLRLCLRLPAIHEVEVEVEMVSSISEILDRTCYKNAALILFPVPIVQEKSKAKGLNGRAGLGKLVSAYFFEFRVTRPGAQGNLQARRCI